MINEHEREQAASDLLGAERNGNLMQRLSERHVSLEIADSYDIQQRVITQKIANGAKLIGHKIGLTSRAMQVASGIDEPDFGHILDEHLLDAARPIALSRFNVPRIEVELAFHLAQDLDMPNPQITDVLSATSWVQPAIEIIDTRTEVPRKVTDTIADNSALGAIVLGGTPMRPFDLDLTQVGGVIYKNGLVDESGVSAAVLGHPANGIVWLAKRIAPFGGVLKAGQLVLAGSFTRPVEVKGGDVVTVHYGRMGLISMSFV